MAGEDRSTSNVVGLFAALSEEPYNYDFFHGLRLIETQYRGLPRIGTSVRPVDDPVRFAQEPSMAFAPSTLARFEFGTDTSPPRLSSYFLGAFGPNGPMPFHVTEYVLERRRFHRDDTLARFADVFHHRLISLFYRAWATAQPAVSYDRPEDDRFGEYVGSLAGLGMHSLRSRDDLPDNAKYHFIGHLGALPRHAEGLLAIIQKVLGMRGQIREFVGEWMAIPPHSRWELGSDPANGSLGTSATVGERVWGCHQKFRLFLGPLDLSTYQQMLPGGSGLRLLVSVVRNYVGDEYNWDVNLVLRKDEVPPLELGKAGQLGWTTWLAGRPADRDADELVLRPLAFMDRLRYAEEADEGDASVTIEDEMAPAQAQQ